MSKKKEGKPTQVVRSDSTRKIVLPQAMTYDSAIMWIQRQAQAEETIRSYSRKIRFHPMDVAVALATVLKDRYGAVLGKRTPTFFSSTPPETRSIPVSRTEKVLAPWGRMTFPPLDPNEEFIQTNVYFDGSYLVFYASGEIKEKNMPEIESLFNAIEAHVVKHSIYRGKAVRISVKSTSTDFVIDPSIDPVFTKIGVKPNDTLFEEAVDQQLNASIYTPLRHRTSLKRDRIPFGRGILLAGPYGCGKTMVGAATATVASENDITYIQLSDVRGLKAGLAFASIYSPAVLFAEDIDRATSGERSPELDAILNTLDGVDTKGRDVLTVLTTNHPDKLNKAMLRPGRLDACIRIGPPDGATAARLLARHTGLSVEECAIAGEILRGHIPARLVETTKRAALFALTLTEGASSTVSGEALAHAAKAVVEEAKIGDGVHRDPTHAEALGGAFEKMVASRIHDTLESTEILDNDGDLWGSMSIKSSV